MFCSRNHFKIIAILFMLIDHIGVFLLNNNMLFRCVGQLAFPMFVYLLADGYRRTKNIHMYLSRLMSLFLVSYFPYSMAMSGSLFFSPQNIYASLFLYLTMYWLLDSYSLRAWETLAVWVLSCFLAVALNLQYGWYGVAIAVVMFYLHDFEIQESCAALIFLGLLYGYTIGFPLQAVGSLSVFLIPYQGNFINSPKPGKGLQWVSYLFYPVHLLFFAALRL